MRSANRVLHDPGVAEELSQDVFLELWRRRESLERVQTAASGLEIRIAELEGQDERLQGFLRRAKQLFDALREQAQAGPVAGNDLISLELPEAAGTSRQRVRA